VLVRAIGFVAATGPTSLPRDSRSSTSSDASDEDFRLVHVGKPVEKTAALLNPGERYSKPHAAPAPNFLCGRQS
jgi:hypothetical protein